MLLRTKGIPYLIDAPIVGRVTRNTCDSVPGGILIADSSVDRGVDISLFKAVLTTDIEAADFPAVYAISSLEHLSEGDLVAIHTEGAVNTLYRPASHHNFLLFTERCNSNCLMCSQPPKNRDDAEYLYWLYRSLIPQIPKDCFELGITGGEPTLLGNMFFSLLEQLQSELPDTEIHCLTNGRSFAWPNMAHALGRMEYHQLMLGIPLYSDYYQQHDYIVQAKDAFNQTMQGLYNLAKYGQRIEIRIVLHKQTIPRLTRLAKFIYKNLPFVEHVAFMGLEHQGYTPYNIDKLWIDPVEYMQELSEAVNLLSDHGMRVSIYNSQLCLMPEELWKFNKRSISDWKNIYLDDCNRCAKAGDCGGLFASAIARHSVHLKPFANTEEIWPVNQFLDQPNVGLAP